MSLSLCVCACLCCARACVCVCLCVHVRVCVTTGPEDGIESPGARVMAYELSYVGVGT